MLDAGNADVPVGANVPSLGLSNKAVLRGQESAASAPSSSLTGYFEEEVAAFKVSLGWWWRRIGKLCC